MPLHDRTFYKGIYAPIVDRVSGRRDSAELKRKKRCGPLTVFQKMGIVRAAFVQRDATFSAVELVKRAAKQSKVTGTARNVERVLVRTLEPGANTVKILADLAKVDDDHFLKIVEMGVEAVDKAVPEPPVIKGQKASIAHYAAGAAVEDRKFFYDPTLYRVFLTPAFGYMHLERLRFTPVGTEVGELVYSLSLAPGEEVYLSQKTWSKTKREFTELVSHEVEKEMTTERTESLELAESTQNQSQFSADMSSSIQGGGAIGVVQISGSASNSLSTSFSETSDESIKRDMKLTERATARSKQEHKTTFQVSTEVGFEEESRRKITNPNVTHAVRYDYFRYMRKWRVDLERYGVRLTMDVMVPDPAERLRTEFDDRRALEDLVSEPYVCPYTEADIDESNLPVGVSARPRPYGIPKSARKETTFGMSEDFAYEFTIPAGYEAVSCDVQITGRYGGTPNVYLTTPAASIQGARGELSVRVHVGLSIDERWVEYTVTLRVAPTEETMVNWRNEVLQAMCLEDLQRWQAERADAQTRLDAMVRREQETPTLTLRKDEREEIMAGVMRLFLPPTLALEDAPSTTVKFMHEAFEWENMSYFLYPYFWQNIESAIDIEHSDSLRRDFLKAGWARVLVPVRAQYEEKVLGYAYTGDPDQLVPSETMRSVAEQIMAAHQTRYAYELTPDGDTSEQFELVATWHEYTPTDALTLVAQRLDGDVAEPSLQQRLTDEHALRIAQADQVVVEAAFSKELMETMQALPDDTKFSALRTGDGGEVEIDTA